MIVIQRFLLLVFILLLINPAAAGEYSITLYTIPAKTQIDFSTPRSMVWTAFGNTLTMHFSQRKHAMGHVFVELSAENSQVFTGSTKKRLFSSGRKELMEGYGLGILFQGIEGKIEFDGVMTRDIASHYHNGDIAFVKAMISKENYERLHYYLEEYQKRGYDTIYNGLNKPREGLGAGCTAFGMSFFEVAGILLPEWESAWFNDVRVPYRLIGGPLTGNKVPLEEVFTANAWAGEEEPHKTFHIADPYLIYEWIHETWMSYMTEAEHADNADAIRFTPVLREKSKGLIIDFSDAPVPDESVFLSPSEDPELEFPSISSRSRQLNR
jgi:hypothetical protein